MNVMMLSRPIARYHTVIISSAPKKRKPDTPVKNEGSISLCFLTTQRQTRIAAMSTTSTKMSHCDVPQDIEKYHNKDGLRDVVPALFVNFHLSFLSFARLPFTNFYTETDNILLHFYKASGDTETFLLAVR